MVHYVQTIVKTDPGWTNTPTPYQAGPGWGTPLPAWTWLGYPPACTSARGWSNMPPHQAGPGWGTPLPAQVHKAGVTPPPSGWTWLGYPPACLDLAGIPPCLYECMSLE